MPKIKELALSVCFLLFGFFYLAVNKLITDKILNIFYLKAEHPGFIKYSLNKLV